MPFDVTRAVSEADSDFYAAAPLTALPFALEQTDVDATRRNKLQRAVSVVAGVLFGALGALAGAAVVMLMLVALVIPATMALVFGIIATIATLAALGVWIKRRAAKGIGSDEARSLALPA